MYLWPTYEHDAQRTGDSLNESTLARSNGSGLRALWAARVGGPISASPAVVNGTAYVGSWNGIFYAFWISNGTLRWSDRLGTGWGTSNYRNGGIAASATVWNGTVFIDAGTSYLYALDAANGSVRWKVDTANESGGGWGYHFEWGSPLLSRGYLYLGTAAAGDRRFIRGQVLQINLLGSTHHIVHSFNVTGLTTSSDVGGSVWSTPAIDPSGAILWVTTGNENLSSQIYPRSLLALNASNISRIVNHWQAGSVGSDDDFGAGPTLFNDSSGHPFVVVTNKDGVSSALSRSNVSSSNWGPVWQDQLASPGGWSIAPATFDGTTLYLPAGVGSANGSVNAVDPGNGTVRWTHNTPGTPLAGLTTVNGLLVDASNFVGLKGGVYYNSNGTGTLEVLNATNGRLLYRYDANESINDEPVVAQGRIIVGTGNQSPSTPGYLMAFGVPLSGALEATRVNSSFAAYAFSANASGGMYPYRYRWQFGDGSGASPLAHPVHNYSFSGNFTVNATVSDYANDTWSGSLTLHVTVPLVATPSVSKNPVDVGRPLWVNLTVHGAPAGLTFVWSGLPPGCVGANVSILGCAPSAPGSFPVNCTLVAPSGQSLRVAFPAVVVNAAMRPVVAAFPLVGPAPLTSTFSSSVSEGTPPYLTQWTFGDGNSSAAASPTYTYRLAGVYSIHLRITDAGAGVFAWDASVRVVGPLTVSLSPSSAMSDAGEAIGWQATLAGGAAPYSFVWYGLPSSCVSANSSNITCRPQAAGSFSIAVGVTDAVGQSASAPSALVVNPPLSVVPRIVSETRPACRNTTASVALLAVTSGGAPPYVVRWLFPNGSLLGSSASVTAEVPSGSTTPLAVNVTDSLNQSVRAVLAIPPTSTSCTSGGPSILPWVVLGLSVAVVGALAARSLLRAKTRRGVDPPRPP